MYNPKTREVYIPKNDAVEEQLRSEGYLPIRSMELYDRCCFILGKSEKFTVKPGSQLEKDLIAATKPKTTKKRK